MTFTRTEVETYYRNRLPALKQISGKEGRMPCPIHQGKDLNFSVDLETGLAICHSQCGKGWDMIGLEMELASHDFGTAKDAVFEIVGRPKVPWEERNLQEIYNYTDENGKTLYQVLRYFGKEFKQRKPNGFGGWHYGLGDVKRVPYRLDRVVKASFISLAEGEKDVHTLEGMGVVASCSSGGAGNVFKPEQAEYFRGKKVAIFADNDEPGRKYAEKTAAALSGIAASVKILELPGLDVKEDITDWVRKGGKKEQIRELYAKANEWSPDWRWNTYVPSENERYVKTISAVVEEGGGLTDFYNLARLEGLQTPFARLSRSLGGGLRPGEVYVLGGNQGSGKTSLALQFAITAIRLNKRVLMFSMEMDHRAIVHRMASMEARVNLGDLMSWQIDVKRKDSTMMEREGAAASIRTVMPKLYHATAELSELPLLISTKAGVTPEHIISESQRLSQQGSVSLIIVDHLQLMDSTESARGDYEKFTKISRVMKQVSMELKVPILLVSQTSRNQSFEKRGELECSDLRGTGAIEEDAAAVLLLYEDTEDRKAAMAEGDGSRYMLGPIKSFLKIGKNRYGIQGQYLELDHYKAFTRFDDHSPRTTQTERRYRDFSEPSEGEVVQ